MPNDLIVDRILRSVIPVLTVVIIGYIYGRWRKPDMSTINKLCMELLVPILIFSVFKEGEGCLMSMAHAYVRTPLSIYIFFEAAYFY